MSTTDERALLDQLRNPNVAERQLAIMALEDVASLDSIDDLIHAVRDSDPTVRRLAVGLLEELGDGRARCPRCWRR